MSYIPHTEEEIKQMLALIGFENLEDLFCDIPQSARAKPLELPDAKAGEQALCRRLEELGAKNLPALELDTYLGAGVYDHYVPAVVDAISSRGEFFTAYTPYQPEISQGTLQVMFEFQSMICELYGMDVSNASVYDGATALNDAVCIARRANPKATKVVVSGALNPQYLRVLETTNPGFEIVTVPFCGDTGRTDLAKLAEVLDESCCAVAVQSPNFFGVIEDLQAVCDIVKTQSKVLYITVSNPMALGTIKAPGHCGADIAVGEAQGLGNYMSFGGPLLGIFTCRKELMRKIPGRVVGQTTDLDGKRAYVMTLRAREQDIRREKATSNICSNQALVALRACVYMAWAGKTGFTGISEKNYALAHYLAAGLEKAGYKLAFSGPYFNEFVVDLGTNHAQDFKEYMLEGGIFPGYELERDFPGWENCMLVAVTEKKTTADLDRYIERAAGFAVQSQTKDTACACCKGGCADA